MARQYKKSDMQAGGRNPTSLESSVRMRKHYARRVEVGDIDEFFAKLQERTSDNRLMMFASFLWRHKWKIIFGEILLLAMCGFYQSQGSKEAGRGARHSLPRLHYPMIMHTIYFQDLKEDTQAELWQEVQRELLASGEVEYRGKDESEEELAERLQKAIDDYNNLVHSRPLMDCMWRGTAKAWIDENGNGNWDANERPLSGVSFHIDDVHNKYNDVGGAVSNAGGIADLSVWLPGCPNVAFEIYVIAPTGYRSTTQPRVSIRGEGPFLFGFAAERD